MKLWIWAIRASLIYFSPSYRGEPDSSLHGLPGKALFFLLDKLRLQLLQGRGENFRRGGHYVLGRGNPHVGPGIVDGAEAVTVLFLGRVSVFAGSVSSLCRRLPRTRPGFAG